MALRGWRLFGVAGTIFAYVAGILLLSIVSLNSPNQRRPRSGRFGEVNFDSYRHREINLVPKRQPLQWCQPLRFLDSDNVGGGGGGGGGGNGVVGEPSSSSSSSSSSLSSSSSVSLLSSSSLTSIGTNKPQLKPMLQTFPGHYVKDQLKNRRKSYHDFGGIRSRGNNVDFGISNGISGTHGDNNKNIEINSIIHRKSAGSIVSVNSIKPIQFDDRYNGDEQHSIVGRSGRGGGGGGSSGNGGDEKKSKLNGSNNNNNDDDVEFPILYEKLLPKHLRNQNNLKKIHDETNRKFLFDQKEKQPTEKTNLIALASFPGSGNTWLRYLLQQATGVYTGSVYKDFGLLKSGFPGENVYNSSVLVIKTHEWGPKEWKHFAKAVLLVRDPDKAILAEFNRQSGGHVGFASPDRYKRTNAWQQFVTNKLKGWVQMNTQWATNYTGAVHIIYYDDLVDDVEGTIRGILKFINYPVNEELLSCTLMRKEGIYRRKKRIMTFDPYTPEMHKLLELKKRQVYSELGRYKF